jgi:hypothetical protein
VTWHRLTTARGNGDVMRAVCLCGAELERIPLDYRYEGLSLEQHPFVAEWLASHGRDVDVVWWFAWECIRDERVDAALVVALDDFARIPDRLSWWCCRVVASCDVEWASMLLVACDRLMIEHEAGDRSWIELLSAAANQTIAGAPHFTYPKPLDDADAIST